MTLPAKLEKAQKSHLKNKCQINISIEKANSPFARLTGIFRENECMIQPSLIYRKLVLKSNKNIKRKREKIRHRTTVSHPLPILPTLSIDTPYYKS